MLYRTLGNSGCAVSAVGLGCMVFGSQCDERTSHALLDAFVDGGGTLIDTADMYAQGASEAIVGSWLAARPSDLSDRIVLATKGGLSTGGYPNGSGASALHLRRALTASLRRLRVDSVDVYQVHAFDPVTPLEETLSALQRFMYSGEIRYYGLSNFTGWQLTKAVSIARELGMPAPVSMQSQYSLIVREIEWEIVPAAMDAGVGLLPWSPLAGGYLSGHFRAGAAASELEMFGTDTDRGIDVNERTLQIVAVAQAVADRHNATIAEVALAWALARPGVTAPISGARSLEEVKATLRATELTLADADLAELDAVSVPLTGIYPYGPRGLALRARDIAGEEPHVPRLRDADRSEPSA